jgi:hypothetical protein
MHTCNTNDAALTATAGKRGKRENKERGGGLGKNREGVGVRRRS